ncbi:MAG: M20/M25/M40 family metallo-hydrolase, partial [Actinomycetaceae bacterium UMB1218B]|nr:M20/M25/M40 family metallo-hydrolase [Actinomycetaceae bacterium UMB1218B]
MTHLRTDDVVDLTCDLIDIPSVSGDEKRIADAIEEALRGASHLEVLRDGDAIVARTNLGRSQRVIIAGHIDTVPISGNVPHVREETEGVEKVRGRGSVDMLGGVAGALYAALKVNEPKHDVTWVFYDHEEVAAPLNGLGRVYRNHPDWIDGQF